jgi:hypothetical protein
MSTSKQVAAAVTAGLAGQLQKLPVPITSSTSAEPLIAWLAKHAALVQGVHTLQLDLQLSDVTRAAADILSLLSSEPKPTTAANAAHVQEAAAILQHMPGTLKALELKLQSSHLQQGSMCRQLSSQATALLQMLQRTLNTTASSPSAAAAATRLPSLPPPGYLFSHLTNLTSLTVTNVHYVKGLQLLPHLPTSLQDLHLDLEADSSTYHRMMENPTFYYQLNQQQQQALQMGHLQRLQSLRITKSTELTLVLGPDSQLPPNLKRLEASCMYVESSTPILALSRLQHFEVGIFDLDADAAAAINSMPQLEYAAFECSVQEDRLSVEAAAELLEALALPSFKNVGVIMQPAGIDDAQPSSIVSQLGSLTNLGSLTLDGGCHDLGELAASIAQLTSLSELSLGCPDGQPVRLLSVDDSSSAGDLMQAVASLPHLRRLRVVGHWFDASAAALDGKQQHPIQYLQAATQLTCLELHGPWPHDKDLAALIASLQGLQMGESLQNHIALQQCIIVRVVFYTLLLLLALVVYGVLAFIQKMLMRMLAYFS